MKQIIIRNLDDSVIHRLKKIAWMNGESPEETARRLLIEAIHSRVTDPRAVAHSVEPAA
jgi:plasmid stability protein